MAPGWSFMNNLPEFHGNPGESWEIYEADIQLAYDGAGQAPDKEEIKRAHILRGLKGEAATFLKLNPHLRTASYDEVRAILKKRFTKPAWQRLGELPYLKQEQGETVKGFAERLKSTVRALSPESQYTKYIPRNKREIEALAKDDKVEALSDEQMKDKNMAYHDVMDMVVFNHFQEGLREEIRNSVKNALPQNLDEAIAIAERYEDQALMLQEGFRRLNVTVADSTVMDPTVKRAEEQLKALNNNDRRPIDRFAGGAPAREDIRCYNCNQRGHYARNCKSRPNRDRYRNSDSSRFMERNEPAPMRRKVPDMSRSITPQRWSNENPHGKRSNGRPQYYRSRPQVEEPNERDRRSRNNGENEGNGGRFQNRKPKNGANPPQRGGLQQPPQPLRFKN